MVKTIQFASRTKKINRQDKHCVSITKLEKITSEAITITTFNAQLEYDFPLITVVLLIKQHIVNDIINLHIHN